MKNFHLIFAKLKFLKYFNRHFQFFMTDYIGTYQFVSKNKIALFCTLLHAQNFSGKHARKPKTRLLVKSFGWLHPSNYGSKKFRLVCRAILCKKAYWRQRAEVASFAGACPFNAAKQARDKSAKKRTLISTLKNRL